MTTMERTLRASSSAKNGTPIAGAPGLTVEEKRYVELLADYCLLAQLRDPESILEGAEFTVDGIDFRLSYAPQRWPGILCVWCDVGEVEEGEEERVYLALLQANLLRHDGSSSMMALCPETDQVISSTRLPLKQLTAEKLDSVIRIMGREAVAWQENFLKKPDQASRS